MNPFLATCVLFLASLSPTELANIYKEHLSLLQQNGVTIAELQQMRKTGNYFNINAASSNLTIIQASLDVLRQQTKPEDIASTLDLYIEEHLRQSKNQLKYAKVETVARAPWFLMPGTLKFTDLNFSNSNTLLVANDKQMVVWNFNTREETSSVAYPNLDNYDLLYHYGNYVILRFNNDYKILDVNDGTTIHEFKSDQMIKISKDSKYLYSNSKNLIRIRDASTGKVIRTVRAHGELDADTEISPNGKYLVRHQEDKKALLVTDMATGELLHTLPCHFYRFKTLTLQFSADSKYLVAEFPGQGVALPVVWELKRGTKLWDFGQFGAVVLGASGHLLTHTKNNIILRSFKSGETWRRRNPSKHSNYFFSPKDKYVLVTYRFNTEPYLQIYDTETGAHVFDELFLFSGDVIFSPNEEHALLMNHKDAKSLQVLNLKNGTRTTLREGSLTNSSSVSADRKWATFTDGNEVTYGVDLKQIFEEYK